MSAIWSLTAFLSAPGLDNSTPRLLSTACATASGVTPPVDAPPPFSPPLPLSSSPLPSSDECTAFAMSMGTSRMSVLVIICKGARPAINRHTGSVYEQASARSAIRPNAHLHQLDHVRARPLRRDALLRLVTLDPCRQGSHRALQTPQGRLHRFQRLPDVPGTPHAVRRLRPPRDGRVET